MATLYISEYGRHKDESRGYLVAAGSEPAKTTQKVTFTTATQSSAFRTDTYYVRIYSDAACHFSFGSNPTATTNDPKMNADAPEYFAVIPGHKISVVTA